MPIETVFHQGIVDILFILVTDAALDILTLASLQSGVHYFKMKVLSVVGHELCGLAEAAQLKSIKMGLDQDSRTSTAAAP